MQTNMDRPPIGDVEDLTTLAKLDDHILLSELKARYHKDRIYTYVGDILVAVNPFKDLKIYGQDVSQKYKMSTHSSNSPHIYAVADDAYQAMLGYGSTPPTNQCILISGESGAGKTESTKLIIRQLIELCKGHTFLEQQILQVNPLLEAFGNAQTLMNDNSSRFGKYIQLRFEHGQVFLKEGVRDVQLCGAKISEYLLEKSRLVRQTKGEENFHIFYFMLAGLSAEEKNKYKLDNADSYRYLSHGAPNLKSDAKRLTSMFEELVNAMDLVGFDSQEQEDLFIVLSSILNIGNITFECNDSDASYITNSQFVKTAAELLGISAEELNDCLTFSQTVARGDIIRRNYSKEQAEDARDATTKAIYGRVFGWIVNKINQVLVGKGIKEKEQLEIGILDIFGFEHFDHNSFEQACINLANEQLQFFFNKHIFIMEQEEYKKEGVDWTEIKFVDNKPLLDLFTAKPIGILSLLDEESAFPKATDHSFVEKLNKNLAKNSYFIKAQNTSSNNFTIAHYAGKVQYDAGGWLEKNRDTVPAGVTEMLQRSTNTMLGLVFRAAFTRTGTLAFQNRTSKKKKTTRKMKGGRDLSAAKRKLTVGAQFKNSLQVLMERMTNSTPHFIRCIKPNSEKSANSFNEEYVQAQLLYTGMLETTKIRREGFAVRPTFAEFINKYKILLKKHVRTEDKMTCVEILQKVGVTGYQAGKTKIFMKIAHLEKLAEKLEEFQKTVIMIQKVVRGFLGRRKARRRREAAKREAEKAQALLRQIESLSLTNYRNQQTLIAEDKNIPQAFFDKAKGLPPPPPADYGFPPPPPGIAGTAEAENGEDEGSSGSDSEILEDEFTPVSSAGTKYGALGTRGASVRWFRETQAQKLQLPTGGFAEWFHGIITRRHSEELLMPKTVGCFLIRVSESRFGYSLSFRAETRCRHYMIDQTPSGKYVIVGEPKVHKTLDDMVAYHKRIPISNWAGLLTVPCGQAVGQCDYQELVTVDGEGIYFEMENEGSGDSVYCAAQDFNYDTESYMVPADFATQTSSRRQARYFSNSDESVTSVLMSGVDTLPREIPPLPERTYSKATALDAVRRKEMTNRPLPRKPEEAYASLLEHQERHHGDPSSASRKRISTTRAKLPHS